MAKYNTKKQKQVSHSQTFENGDGLKQTAEIELISILASGLNDTFYENESEREIRFKQLIQEIAQKNPEFVAKALIYARTVFGQRSVTHFGAVELLPFLSGTELAKRFFSKREHGKNKGGIIYRLDDMNEILALYQKKNGKDAAIPNSIKRGFKSVIENSDAYTLAKYQLKNHSVSLVDIVNLVHPHPTVINGVVSLSVEALSKAAKGTKYEEVYDLKHYNEKEINVPTLTALVLGTLKQFNTVEDKNSNAGKTVAEKIKSRQISEDEAKNELKDLKTQNYKELIRDKKIGYLALLRNLRNIIITQDEELIDEACNLLVNEEFIRKSLVWPIQIDLANEVLQLEFKTSSIGKVISALNTAYERSIPNLQVLMPKRKTAVVFDSSGSMSTNITLNDKRRGVSSALNKARLIAATFGKGLNADIYTFASSCKLCQYNPTDSINTIKKSISLVEAGGMTSWNSIFPVLMNNGGYERIIIISDEQSKDNALFSYKSYCEKYGTPYLYIINICGYGTTTNIRENSKTFRIYGYNQDIYVKASTVEIDPVKVIEEIKKINI